MKTARTAARSAPNVHVPPANRTSLMPCDAQRAEVRRRAVAPRIERLGRAAHVQLRHPRLEVRVGAREPAVRGTWLPVGSNERQVRAAAAGADQQRERRAREDRCRRERGMVRRVSRVASRRAVGGGASGAPGTCVPFRCADAPDLRRPVNRDEGAIALDVGAGVPSAHATPRSNREIPGASVTELETAFRPEEVRTRDPGSGLRSE